ncbi:hypothetical protein C1J03_14725 [Sulfitobacter sp. SK012]|uniref:hypothetical protein n=1 Tax=Sulfitobacter sp. SK012 TaxID=1389005 RepID=UPI000E0ABE5E|nr:hypothetical protein [Sulfitobacter sp. SK012]AXI47158.1 hypothetical protein C1J03_14725 [Sulfitobacter sp. SK012]
MLARIPELRDLENPILIVRSQTAYQQGSLALEPNVVWTPFLTSLHRITNQIKLPPTRAARYGRDVS